VNETNYEPYELGKAEDIYVKWPNASIMPEEDFLATRSTALLGYVSNVNPLTIVIHLSH